MRYDNLYLTQVELVHLLVSLLPIVKDGDYRTTASI